MHERRSEFIDKRIKELKISAYRLSSQTGWTLGTIKRWREDDNVNIQDANCRKLDELLKLPEGTIAGFGHNVEENPEERRMRLKNRHKDVFSVDIDGRRNP